MQPENSPEFTSFDQFLAGNSYVYGFPAMQSQLRTSSVFDFTEGIDGGDHDHDGHQARAFAASENHKEAERKRRERINKHLDRLRALLFCNSKTDKASLLAKVVQRVRELKQQTSEIMQFDQTALMIPSESDEIAVLKNDDSLDGRSVVKASLCCEDRVDLIPDLIEVLKPLPLSPLRAEMVTMGGRIRNVLVLAGDKDQTDESVLLLRDALKRMVVRSSYVAGERSKRRRMFDQGILS